jgi:undecaprenyl diphosphate synthase
MAIDNLIDKHNIPKHVAITMDGNGRWAKKQGEERVYGHKNGVEPIRQCTEAAAELGIEFLTLYAFSTENWNRPKEEVEALMTLLVQTINNEVEQLNKNNIRLQAIGNLSTLPQNCYAELQQAIEKTKNNTRLTLVLALSYSSRWEITNAIKTIAQKVNQNTLSIAQINEDTVIQHLNTASIPDPEMLIRTSGEHRVSNFLLWQIAYSELYFTDVLWPDFKKQDFFDAIVSYQKRERRFGKTSEQISTT